MSNSPTHPHLSGFLLGDHEHPTHSHPHHDCSGHTHHSHDSGNHNRDFNAENNRRHFDDEAATYDEKPGAVNLARTQCEILLQMYPFNKDSTMVMDYACGTGLVSRQLYPFVKSIVGIDISQGMVDQYNKWANEQNIHPNQMKALRTELQGKEEELDGCKFDVVVCAMAYHHFSSIEAVTHTLAHFIKPGGSLIVMDMMKPENVSDAIPPPDHAHHVVPHTFAFSEADIRLAFENAELEGFTFRNTGSMVMHGRENLLFIATGTKR